VAIPFGVHDLVKSAYYQVFTNVAPGLVTGPKVRALPADLAAAPLSLFQPAASSALPEKPRTVSPRQPIAPKPAAKPAQQAPRAGQQRPSAPAPVMPPVAASSAAVDVPVHVPVGGMLRAVDATGASVTFTTSGETPDKTGRTLIVHIPPTDHDR